MIRVELHESQAGVGSIAEVILDRPQKKNALTPEMAERLTAELEGLCAAKSQPRALVLRGAGDVFCAGFDLKLCHEDPENLRRLLVALSGAIVAMRRFEGVVVCGVHGAAVAGGCALLGGADVVVCDRGTRLGYPVVRLGISPAVSAPFLVHGVGSGGARGMMLDPELITAERASELGLVHELVDGGDWGAGEVAARAMELAREATAKPAVGLRATKKLLNELDGSEHVERAMNGLRVSLGLVGDEESRRRLLAMWG